MKKYTVDRIESDQVVLLLREDESVKIDVQFNQLPKGINEGDIIEVEFDEFPNIKQATILKEETTDAQKRIEKLQQKLLNKNKEND